MSCPICDHTMEAVIECKPGGTAFHWCPRCGTLSVANGLSVSVPKLVERCREFQANLCPETQEGRDWHRLGIAESINPPGKRGG